MKDVIVYGSSSRPDLLGKLWELLASFFCGCRHIKVTFPQNHRQHCLDCGMFRFYELGQKPSRWYRYQYEGHVKPNVGGTQ